MCHCSKSDKYLVSVCSWRGKKMNEESWGCFRREGGGVAETAMKKDRILLLLCFDFCSSSSTNLIRRVELPLDRHRHLPATVEQKNKSNSILVASVSWCSDKDSELQYLCINFGYLSFTQPQRPGQNVPIGFEVFLPGWRKRKDMVGNYYRSNSLCVS